MNEKECTSGSFEEALMRELRFGSIDKENLKELVGIVAGVHKEGLKQIKVFPRGIPGPADSVRITGVLEVGEASKFLAEILQKTPRLGGIEVFPYGIPWPEIVTVNIDIGAPVETGPINRF